MVAAAPSPDAVLDRIRDLVEADPANEDPAALNVRGYALLARLKALNRQANAATKEHKLATAAARTDVNQTHLGLQNLLYEKRHLEREIEKCRQFACVHSQCMTDGNRSLKLALARFIRTFPCTPWKTS